MSCSYLLEKVNADTSVLSYTPCRPVVQYHDDSPQNNSHSIQTFLMHSDMLVGVKTVLYGLALLYGIFLHVSCFLAERFAISLMCEGHKSVLFFTHNIQMLCVILYALYSVCEVNKTVTLS